MRVVSENSEEDLGRKFAQDKVDWCLRNLTANLLRVTRGAGKPYEIGRQVQALLEAIVEYNDRTGHFPSEAVFTESLTAERGPEVMERLSDLQHEEDWAEQRIIRGSLQITASRLLGQNTQERHGHHEMLDGFNALKEVRQKQRIEWARNRAGKPKLARPSSARKRSPKGRRGK